MNREDALYYLKSSGMSDEQVDTVVKAIERSLIEKISAEIKDYEQGMIIAHREGYASVLSHCLALIDKYKEEP
jgi:primosomal protein N'